MRLLPHRPSVPFRLNYDAWPNVQLSYTLRHKACHTCLGCTEKGRLWRLCELDALVTLYILYQPSNKTIQDRPLNYEA